MVAGLLAELRVQRDIAAEERLDARAHVANDRARANYDTSRDPEGSRHAEVREVEPRCDQCVIDVVPCHGETIHRASKRQQCAKFAGVTKSLARQDRVRRMAATL